MKYDVLLYDMICYDRLSFDISFIYFIWHADMMICYSYLYSTLELEHENDMIIYCRIPYS